MIVTLGQQYHVGGKLTVIQYTHINHNAGTPHKTKTKDTMSLDCSSVCNTGSRVVWVSMKEICYQAVMSVEGYILTRQVVVMFSIVVTEISGS